MRIVIIQGSSRSTGNTRTVINALSEHLSFDMVDLLDYRIEQYAYDHRHHGHDDFMPLMRKLVEYDLMVFATPVYWYAMSGLMKTFFDRFTDCLEIEKETGRMLRGKAMAALSVSPETEPVEGFFVPFTLSANYLGMRYVGEVHVGIKKETIKAPAMEALEIFANRLLQV